VAAVNGVFITRADLALAGKPTTHGTQMNPGEGSNEALLVERLVRQELAAQRAVELGLDQDPEYLAELAELEAQVAAFRRERLAQVYHRDAGRKIVITDEEARAYYDAHAAQIRSQPRVFQILSRDEAKLRAAADALARGTPFEEVAAAQFPSLPPGQTPWDMGFLRWHQLPDAWAGVIEGLADGEVSGVIRGPSRRFWIIKVVGRRDDPGATFEAVKPLIVDLLREQRLAGLRDQADAELMGKAKIVYAPVATR
jgi:parvulin-like peptidyl-prolyl isomerase